MVPSLLTIATLTEYVIERRRRTNFSEDRETLDGSESTIVFNSNQKWQHVTCFNAPSIALTYKYVPDLKKSLSNSSVFVDMLCSFSIRISTRHLLRNTAKEIPCLNGIKVLSSLWVIFGHACLFMLPYMDNYSIFIPILADSIWLAPALCNSSLAVDSFIFISGAVVAFNYRKRLLFRGEEGRNSIPHAIYRLFMFYFHRLCRLCPAVIATTAFMYSMFNQLGDGPLWSKKGVFGTMCPPNAVWPHLFFLSNWFPSNCLPWLWYIAVDFQLYIFSPFFLFMLLRWHRLANSIAVCLVLLSMSYQVAVYTLNMIPANAFMGLLSGKNIESAEKSFRLLHASPVARCSSFIIGILTGWTACVRSPRHLSTIQSSSLHVVALLLMYFAVFSPFCREGLLSYVHAVIHRSAWSAALSIIVLSLGLFLIHEPILLYYIWSSRVPHSPHSFFHFVWLTLTVFVLSLLLSFVLAITIEIPVLSMERRLLKTAEWQVPERIPSVISRERYAQCSEEPNFYEKTTLWLREENVCQVGNQGPTTLPFTPCTSLLTTNATNRKTGNEGLPSWPATACTSVFSVYTPQHPDNERLVGRQNGEPSCMSRSTQQCLHDTRQNSSNLQQWEKSLYTTFQKIHSLNTNKYCKYVTYIQISYCQEKEDYRNTTLETSYFLCEN
ncbi:hypothetical protein GCK32_010373 [Trichostrongylus colubriformis]|uniref:Acyltransferase 3 domain-containing protein n=1 Tax=Trichostrongylus colubriformis TaxID=6319 RepID=A0AAN8IVV5_TRICO